MKFWFEDESDFQPESRRNSLQRIAVEAQAQEEAQIQGWLELAGKLFDKDQDPTAA